VLQGGWIGGSLCRSLSSHSLARSHARMRFQEGDGYSEIEAHEETFLSSRSACPSLHCLHAVPKRGTMRQNVTRHTRRCNRGAVVQEPQMRHAGNLDSRPEHDMTFARATKRFRVSHHDNVCRRAQRSDTPELKLQAPASRKHPTNPNPQLQTPRGPSFPPRSSIVT